MRYDPRDLGAVFVETPSGAHARVPYADLRRPPISLWEHREAVKRLRADGRRTVDEHAIFAAIEGQRRVVVEAGRRSKAARRELARGHGRQRDGAPAGRHASAGASAGLAPPDAYRDAEVPVPTAEDIGKTEFWS